MCDTEYASTGNTAGPQLLGWGTNNVLVPQLLGRSIQKAKKITASIVSKFQLDCFWF